jgi:hypothetical protein
MLPINLADPAFEPTDQQLVDLSKRAFAILPEKRRAIDRPEIPPFDRFEAASERLVQVG